MEIQHISFANADELMDAANSDYIRFSIPKPGCTASQMSLVTLGGIRCIRHAFQFAGNAEGCTPENVYSFLFSLGRFSYSSICEKPVIEFIGVLISCDILAKKLDLSLSDSSALFFAICRFSMVC